MVGAGGGSSKTSRGRSPSVKQENGSKSNGAGTNLIQCVLGQVGLNGESGVILRVESDMRQYTY